MPALDVAPGQWSSAEYRRRARHLRKVYAAEPASMHRHLRDLAHRHDTWRMETGEAGTDSSNIALGHPSVRRVARPDPTERAAFEINSTRFSELVERRIQNGVLRCQSRAELLREARRQGIGRFYANLVIATVQQDQDMRDSPCGARETEKKALPGLLIVATAALLQGLILLLAWRITS